jgi:hypothetical protein
MVLDATEGIKQDDSVSLSGARVSAVYAAVTDDDVKDFHFESPV